MENRWHCIEATLAHQGAGKFYHIPIYVWVKDPIKAIDKYKYMRGLKKRNVPPVRPIVIDEERKKLEQMIVEDGLSLQEAKEKWYTTAEEYKWWKRKRR